MSKLTEVLKLLCYDPETDGNLTFNVTEALTKNWEKIDQLVLLAVAAAAAYDPEGSYAVGDYCTHGGKLHKCGTEIPDGEAWNAEHWTETTVAAELAEVRASLSNKVAQLGSISAELFDDPTYSNGYFASVEDVTDPKPNMPAAGHWRLAYLPYFAAAEGWATQIAVGAVENSGLCWRKASGTEWKKWEFAATTTPPEETTLPLVGDATSSDEHGGYKCVFRKDQFGKVYITLGIKGTFENNGAIFQLPEDCRPDGNVVIGAYVDGEYSSFIRIDKHGTGYIYTNNPDASFSYIYASGEFYAAQ